MSVLNSEMKRLVERQKLGFVFADIRSPGSVSNIRHNPAVEINVVDPILRKGYRFNGVARVLGDGALFDEIRRGGSPSLARLLALDRARRFHAVQG